MKRKLINLVVVLLIGISTVFAQSKTGKFKVYGNCDMCKNRIEKAVMKVPGVSKADWNKETKIIELSYDQSKTNKDKIELVIAKAGHDSEMHKADDKTYNALSGCCQYKREKSDKKIDGHNGHM